MMLQKPQAKPTEGQSLQSDPISDNGPLPMDEEPKERGRLLVVEDSRSTQRIICSLLGKMNIETETAENGQNGLRDGREVEGR